MPFVRDALLSVLLLLVYLLVLLPIALLVRLFADPLRRRRTSASYWHESTPATRGALRP